MQILPDGETHDDAEVVPQELIGARLGVVDVHVDSVVDEVPDAEGERQEENLARPVDHVSQDLGTEVKQVDGRRQAGDGAVQERRRNVAELPRVLWQKKHCLCLLAVPHDIGYSIDLMKLTVFEVSSVRRKLNPAKKQPPKTTASGSCDAMVASID